MSSESRSVGFAYESNPKFQTASFTQHYRGQSPRYNVHRRGKRPSENGRSDFCRNLRRHSRAGGNPDLGISEIFQDCCNFKLLDSRLRGNDTR